MSLWSLPEEIQLDIFLRLPLNSIGFSRCVCKPFSYLLSSPRFLNTHLNHHTIQNNKNPRLLFRGCGVDSGMGLYSIDYASVSSTTISKSIVPKEAVVRMYYPFECDKIISDRFKVIGSCNGLICLRFSSETQSTTFCLWNPLTGEYRRLHPPNNKYDLGYGFGYDCHNNDYKLVRLIGCSKAEVYTLGSDSWKIIRFKRYPYACAHKESSGFFFNGALHWLYITDTPKAEQIIVSFDLSNEIFTEFPLPEQPLDDQGGLGLGILGSCLCLVYNNPRRFDIWVMQDYNVKDSWTRQFTTVRHPFTSYTFRRPIWSFENGEILIGTDKGFVLIDPSKHGFRTLGTRPGYGVGKLIVNQPPTDYVESLVSLDAHTYVIKGENPMQLRSFQQSCRGAY